MRRQLRDDSRFYCAVPNAILSKLDAATPIQSTGSGWSPIGKYPLLRATYRAASLDENRMSMPHTGQKPPICLIPLRKKISQTLQVIFQNSLHL